MRNRNFQPRRISPNQSRTPVAYEVGADSRPKLGGLDLIDLTRTYGTPLYVLDAATIRATAGAYRETLIQEYSGESMVLFASKANLSMGMCKLMEQEGLGLDVVSGGELYTAIQAGFPLEKVLFNGNNKTWEELEMAIHHKVGRISVDNFHEMALIDQIASKKKTKVQVLLRITPGIECHTHDYIKTGQVDTKFGFDLTQLSRAIDLIVQQYGETMELKGLHAHIGSQIFEIQPYEDLVQVMLNIFFNIRHAYDGLTLTDLNLGGGLGIQYTKEDDPPKVQSAVSRILNRVKFYAEQIKYPLPRILIEPGRSIVGPAGMTLYEVGSTKIIPRVKKFVAVNGGMGDNIRPSLYQAQYTAQIANKLNLPADETVTVVGKYCESGDVLIPQVILPKVEAGDILMVFGTGAYNYSMASNYNRIPRPATVLVENGKAHLLIKRESYETVIQSDLIPAYLMEPKPVSTHNPEALFEEEGGARFDLPLPSAREKEKEKDADFKSMAAKGPFGKKADEAPTKNEISVENRPNHDPVDERLVSAEFYGEQFISPVQSQMAQSKTEEPVSFWEPESKDLSAEISKKASFVEADHGAKQASEHQASAGKSRFTRAEAKSIAQAPQDEAALLQQAVPNVAPLSLAQLEQIDPDAYLDALDYQQEQQQQKQSGLRVR